jgi:hypothetical protein
MLLYSHLEPVLAVGHTEKQQELMGTCCGTKMHKRIRVIVDERGTGAVAGLALGGAVEGSTGAETRDRTAA